MGRNAAYLSACIDYVEPVSVRDFFNTGSYYVWLRFMWGEPWVSLLHGGVESAVIPDINIMIKDISIITDSKQSFGPENEALLSSWVLRRHLMLLI